MKTRKSLLAAVVSAALLSPLLAHASETFEITDDEIGVATHYAPGASTRAQVQQDMAQWNRQPLAGDGWREVDGEQGWQAPQAGRAAPAQAPTIAQAAHEHWQAVSGEAAWVGPFGV